MPMPCRRPVLRTQPNSRCSASSTGAEQVLRARFFRLNPGPPRGAHTDLDTSPIRSVWRFHVPRIWNRSINGRIFSVKRKTQNVVDAFVARLFVVVLFLLNRFHFNAFRLLVSHATLLHPIQNETLSSHVRLLLPSSSSPFCAIAIANPDANLCSSLPQTAHGEKVRISGIPNAGKITDFFYRGAQPREVGFSELKILGITTIVDLRGEDREKILWERKHAESLGMRFVNIPVSGWSPPSDEQVAQFLSLLRDRPGQKIFVHCRFGDDRTGVFTAVYRMAVEKWPADQALKEMYFFGFNGFWHPSMKTFVRDFPSRLNSAPALAPLRSTPAQP